MAAGQATETAASRSRWSRSTTAARDAALARQAQLVKPPGSLGRLEELAVWLAGVTGSERPEVRPRVVVAAADHGVAASGAVSAYPPEVTVQMLATLASGRAAVSALAREAGAEVVLRRRRRARRAGVRGRRARGHRAVVATCRSSPR